MYELFITGDFFECLKVSPFNSCNHFTTSTKSPSHRVISSLICPRHLHLTVVTPSQYLPPPHTHYVRSVWLLGRLSGQNGPGILRGETDSTVLSVTHTMHLHTRTHMHTHMGTHKLTLTCICCDHTTHWISQCLFRNCFSCHFALDNRTWVYWTS